MNHEERIELENMALRVREHIIRLSTDGGCFTGASLSCADLLVYLYNRFLNVGPHNFDAADRDYLFLSKGHDVPALYGTFVELGWLPRERLANHLKTNDTVYWHPNRNVPAAPRGVHATHRAWPDRATPSHRGDTHACNPIVPPEARQASR